LREFPSPCGEKVGINAALRRQLKEFGVKPTGFRPLAGKR